MKTTRRDFVKAGLVTGVGTSLGVPAYLRRAWAADPIKIGLPAALSGGNAQYGVQAKRACELFAKEMKAKGGILGRPVEFIYEDTAGDPATAVRKAQKLVEKDGVKFLTGVALSSEALAVSAKCPEWKVIFMSTINGAGSLTAKSWNRYFFRVNTSGPMGARAVSLYLTESPMKRFFGLGGDYAWGRDSVGSFEKLITGAGKEIVGKDFPPVGTKDFASYVAKVKQSGAQGCYLALPGAGRDDLLQAGVPVRLDARGEADHGDRRAREHEGGRRRDGRHHRRLALPVHGGHAENRDFVKRFHEMHGLYPDMFDGETYEGVEWLAQVIQKAGTADDVEKVIEAWEDSPVRGTRGAVLHAQVRSPGGAARIRRRGGQGPEVSAPHPEDPRDLPRGQGDPEVPHGGLLVGPPRDRTTALDVMTVIAA